MPRAVQLVLGASLWAAAAAWAPAHPLGTAVRARSDAAAPAAGIVGVGLQRTRRRGSEEDDVGGGVTSFADAADFTAGTGAVAEGELMVVKFWAPWCRACKGLEPKYKQVANKYPALTFKQLNWEDNRDFCKTIGVTALPLVKMFTADGEVESFPCGPKKVEILRGKLDEWNVKVGGAALPQSSHTPTDSDASTAAAAAATAAAAAAAVAAATPGEPSAALAATPVGASAAAATGGMTAAAAAAAGATMDLRRITGAWLKKAAPALFGHLTEEQAKALVATSVVTSWTAGDVITEQGTWGSRLYIILSGETEVFKRPEDQIAGMGAKVNTLSVGGYFGERSLLSSEPRSFSVAASAPVVKCLTLEFSALVATDPDTWKPGSNFRPNAWGIDAGVAQAKLTAPIEAKPDKAAPRQERIDGVPTIVRFKLLRSAVRAFEHAFRRSSSWGNAQEQALVQALVAGLSARQVEDYKLAFKIFDSDGNGRVEASELSKAMAIFKVTGKTGALSTAELDEMIDKANPNVNGNTVLYEEDFIAMMAEAEYSSFFLEAFALLDVNGYGFVEAGQLKAVLNELQVLDTDKLEAVMAAFGVDADGQIQYEAFVNLLMSTNTGGISTGFGFSLPKAQ